MKIGQENAETPTEEKSTQQSAANDTSRRGGSRPMPAILDMGEEEARLLGVIRNDAIGILFNQGLGAVMMDRRLRISASISLKRSLAG